MNKCNKKYPGYIYVYINIHNGKKYVGQTCNIKQRHAAHLHKKTNSYFDAAFQKDPDAFKLQILSVFCCSSIEARNAQMDKLEKYWIKKLHTYWYKYPDNGYNLTLGGDGNGGKKRRCKISIYDFETKEEFEKAKYQLRKEQMKKYREEHKEYFRRKSHEYLVQHRDEINKQRRERHALNPKPRTEEQKRRARESTRRYRERKKHENNL